ncbi:AAA domain-containing protein [Tepidibacillus infernus]|uniref:AAA domain-containing protein n=1 Tax=Tepidibacillus infernus TaxID=1806172 RepID=UPI003B714BFA
MEAIINEEKEIAKNKLMKVFKYLQSLDQIRNPVKRSITEQLWTLWLHDFPDHETITFQNGIDNESDIFIVKVRRPEITKCPPPSAEIKEWLDSGWEKPENMVSFQTEKELMDEEGEPILIQFDEDDERVRLSEQWMKKRTEWAKLEIPARTAMRIYERLYDLYARIEREYEQVELLVGDGVLTWRTYNIFHPVLLRKVQLDFDPNIPEFTIRETEQTSEFYTSLFREIDEVHPQAVRRILDDLENGHWEPLDDLETTEFFKRLVSLISSNGKYVEDDKNLMDRTIPYIKRDPVFFLRRRSLGFTRTLEAILEDLPQREEVPEAVSRIVGIHPKKEVESEEFSFVNLDVNGEDERILLSKEANQEQLKIALQLKKYGSVLVQGPPGTGKTHTIANLIGHLLSEEKKVLVTSHTAKALSVLREKVVEPLQSLCVSVLDHDSSKEQLANSIDEINERLSLIDIEVLQKEVDKIETDRKKIIKKLKELRHQLTQTRLNEYRPIVFAGQDYDPSKAARKIANSSEDEWIPGPVKLGEPLPLSIEELQLLYETNEKLTKLEEVELRMPLSKTSDLMPPDQYQEIISEQHQLQMKSVNDQKELWNSDNQSMEALRKVLMSLEKAKNLLKEDGWAYSLFDAGKEDNKKKVWLEFFNEIEEVYQLSLKANSSFIKYGPQLPENMELNEIVQTLEQILTYLKQNKKIGSLQLLLKKDWKQLINQSKVDGNKPESIEHFEALYQQVQLKIARNKLVNRWDRQVTSINGPDSKSLGNEPEKLARQHVIEMKKWLEWFSQDWKKLTIDMNSIGLKWETILAKTPKKVHVHGDIIQLKEGIDSAIQLIQSRINKLKYNQNQKSISILKEKLEKSLEASPDSMVTKGLLHAVASENVKDYRNHYERLRTLELKTEIYQLRTKLLTKLKSFAPAWAESIKERVEIHGSGKIPGDVEKAWIFRQLYDELELRGSTSIEGLQTEITQLSNQLRIITTTLIEKKAWLGQAKRTTNTERQALAGWKALMKKVGKGTGKRAPYLLAEARKQMAVAQSAVPVWIMPISRVVESFNPKENQFDVVIIDEASQSDVMALTALYYGKQVVVVGDDEQVSPDAVGQKLDVTQQLIDTMLDGISNKQLYDAKRQFMIWLKLLLKEWSSFGNISVALNPLFSLVITYLTKGK